MSIDLQTIIRDIERAAERLAYYDSDENAQESAADLDAAAWQLDELHTQLDYADHALSELVSLLER